MGMITRVHRDLQAPSPSGCGSQEVGSLIQDFFAPKPENTIRKYWLKFRHYAEFLKIHRGAWPGALEALLSMNPEAGRARVEAFRAWLRLHKRGYSGKRGSEGPGMFTFLRFAKERGLISWSYPPWNQINSEELWDRVAPEFKARFAEWMITLRNRNYSPQSLDRYRVNLREYGEYLRDRNVSYTAVDYAVANEWIEHLHRQPRWKNSYKRSKVDCAKHFYRWLRARRLISENPFEEIGPIRAEKRLPEFMTEAEVVQLIEAAGNCRDRAVAEFLYASGCRVGEASQLDLAKVSLENRTAKVLGKSGRERMLLFNEAAVTALQAYLPERAEILRSTQRRNEDALFVNGQGRRLSVAVIQKTLKRMASRAGLRRRVSPHIVRHSFATHLLNHGADIYSLMQLLGHSSIQATTVYLHVATERLAEIYKRCHPRH